MLPQKQILFMISLLSCDNEALGFNNFYRIFVKGTEISHSCFLHEGIVTSLKGCVPLSVALVEV